LAVASHYRADSVQEYLLGDRRHTEPLCASVQPLAIFIRTKDNDPIFDGAEGYHNTTNLVRKEQRLRKINCVPLSPSKIPWP